MKVCPIGKNRLQHWVLRMGQPMGQPQAVPFEKPSDTKGSAEWDNFGERVEEAPFEGDLDLSLRPGGLHPRPQGPSGRLCAGDRQDVRSAAGRHRPGRP
jgi:hypothetical protein